MYNRLPKLFEVSEIDLNRLDEKESVDIFRKLLHAEAYSQVFPVDKINISPNTKEADAGIDAIVEAFPDLQEEGLLKPNGAIYQIKSDDKFKGFSKGSIIKELLGIDKEQYEAIENSKAEILRRLKPGIIKALEANKSYILVSFRKAAAGNKKQTAIDLIKKILETTGFCNAKVDIFDSTNLIGFINKYPSIVLNLKRAGNLAFFSHYEISQSGFYNQNFKEDKCRVEIITKLQSLLRGLGSLHIRVLGDAGIGKTKLVIEATSPADLASSVIYCKEFKYFEGSELYLHIIRNPHIKVILIIDECNYINASKLWQDIKNLCPNLKLITIYNDSIEEERSSDIRTINIPALDKQAIRQILEKDYTLDEYKSQHIAELCEGFPRVAHIVGENLKSEDNLSAFNNLNTIWDRYIAGTDEANSDETRKKLLVLKCISLFKKFGYDKQNINEAKFISGLIEKKDASINWDNFIKYVEEFKKRKILQGDFALYITPKIFHIWLFCKYWEQESPAFFDFNKFIENMPEQLIDWLAEMFEYAGESPASRAIVNNIFSKDGLFKDINSVNNTRFSRFFLKLTSANQELALKWLDNIITNSSDEDLLNFKEGRMNIVCALEKIIFIDKYFKEGSKLLFRLAENENEFYYSNNASGEFKARFPIYLSKTQVDLSTKFELIKELFTKNINNKQSLEIILGAISSALETRYFGCFSGAERQGIRTYEAYVPKTYGEIFDYYENNWNLLIDNLDNLPKSIQVKVVKLIFAEDYGLMGLNEYWFKKVVQTIIEVEKKKIIPDKDFLKELIGLIRILKSNKIQLNLDYFKMLENLRDKLYGENFESGLKAALSLDNWNDYDFNEQGEHIDNLKIKIDRLAQEAVNKREIVESNLYWLISNEAKNSYGFAYEFSKLDNNFILEKVLSAYENDEKASPLFISGYLRAYFEKSEDECEELLDKLAKEDSFVRLIPDITWRACPSDRGIQRTIILLKDKKIHTNQLYTYFHIDKMSDASLIGLLKLLITENSSVSMNIALDLVFYLKTFRKADDFNFDKKLLYRILTKSISPKDKEGNDIRQKQHEWVEIAKKTVTKYPDKKLCLILANEMVKNLRKDDTLMGSYHSEALIILDLLAQNFQDNIWNIVMNALENTKSAKTYLTIGDWLRGDYAFNEVPGALELFDDKLIFNWIDENVSSRAPLIARYAPRYLITEEKCLARKILIKYGDMEKVQTELYANFGSGGHVGPRSQYLLDKKEYFENYLKNETNSNVIKWVKKYIKYLEYDIEQSKIEEERFS